MFTRCRSPESRSRPRRKSPPVCCGYAGHYAESDDLGRGRIAVGTRHMLLDHMPKGSKLRLSQVKLFEKM